MNLTYGSSSCKGAIVSQDWGGKMPIRKQRGYGFRSRVIRLLPILFRGSLRTIDRCSDSRSLLRRAGKSMVYFPPGYRTCLPTKSTGVGRR